MIKDTTTMRKNLLSIAIAVVALMLMDGVAAAQEDGGPLSPWSVGVRTGWTTTTIDRYDAGRMDEQYSALGGLEAGLQARYTINPWLALEANPTFMQRSHRMDRNLNYLDPVYTEHLNNYLMLPVMADFSFGGTRMRGHLLAGAYVGYWLSERRRGTTYWMTDYYVYFEPFDETRTFTSEDRRFCGGMAIGAAITYTLAIRWELGIDARYYYDLTSHHKGYAQLSDPRYLNTLSLTIGLKYSL